MSNDVKVCVLCRKEIDAAAVVCPYCRGDVNYRYFQEVPANQVIKERSPMLYGWSFVGFFVVLFFVLIFSLMLGGLWVGIAVLVLAGAGFGGILNKIGKDSIKTACRCGHGEIWRWEKGTLTAGKQAFFDCKNCGGRTRIIITP